MRVTLDVRSGPDAPRSIVIGLGPAVRVGRKAPSEFVLSGDPTLSRVHFSIEWDGVFCRVRDLGSRSGTQLNERSVTESLLRDGDLIVAGETAFVVRIEEVAPAGPAPVAPVLAAEPGISPPKDPAHARLIEILDQQSDPLFALLDAARDPLVLARLLEGKERYQSLYEGPVGNQLVEVAPYLVALGKGSALLTTLVADGWGNAWGVYLTARASFEDVRKHLCRFVKIKAENGKSVYFRFYDPRVLRGHLPSCTPTEHAGFFGPVLRFFVESAEPGMLLQFDKSGSPSRPQKTELSEKSTQPVASA